MVFREFQVAVQKQFAAMQKFPMFRVDVDKNELWQLYLNSFPEGTNPIYKERTEHDCVCCKQFIRAVGNVVAINPTNNKLMTIWDGELGGFYGVVSAALADYIRTKNIVNVFASTEKSAGTSSSTGMDLSGKLRQWDHFFVSIPSKYVKSSSHIDSLLGDIRTNYDMAFRGFTALTVDALDTVLELTVANTLYRASEKKWMLDEVKKLKTQFDRAEDKALWLWARIQDMNPGVARFKNDVLGTLLMDLSEGYELEDSVKSYEQKVAPSNYRRPTALVSKKMIEDARKTLEEAGLLPSLERRPAILEDISVNNVIWSDTTVRTRMKDVFDGLMSGVPTQIKNFDRVEEISIAQFLSDIVPTASKIEAYVDNKLSGNFVSLIAPVDATAPDLFKWGNGFSWSYNGDAADSYIKQRVKSAGGSIEGVLCCRLAWDYSDDLDFHMKEDKGTHIYYGTRRTDSTFGGQLDLDANGMDGIKAEPVENIYYRNTSKFKGDAILTLSVNNYNRRSNGTGFTVELEFGGATHTINYDKVLKNGETIEVAKIRYIKKTDSFELVSSLPSTARSTTVWNVETMNFIPVNVLMFSPNYWDGQEGIGNKHYFFMLEDCHADTKVRGFYNEFLRADLEKHRKVLEMVGAKMAVDETKDQLSGLGFSSTLRNSLLVRVTGKTQRVLKINF